MLLVAAVDLGLGRRHALGDRGDGVGHRLLEVRGVHRQDQLVERREAGAVRDLERERRKAAAAHLLDGDQPGVDAGGGQRRPHDVVQRAGVARPRSGHGEQRGDEHVAADAVRAVEVEDHRRHSTPAAGVGQTPRPRTSAARATSYTMPACASPRSPRRGSPSRPPATAARSGSCSSSATGSSRAATRSCSTPPATRTRPPSSAPSSRGRCPRCWARPATTRATCRSPSPTSSKATSTSSTTTPASSASPSAATWRRPWSTRCTAPSTTQAYAFYEQFQREVAYVGISEYQQSMGPAGMNWAGLAYNAIAVEQWPYTPQKDDYLLAFGRVCEAKGFHLSIEAAKRTGHRLIMAGVLQEPYRDYFEEKVEPLIDGEQIVYEGEVERCAQARAVRARQGVRLPHHLAGAVRPRDDRGHGHGHAGRGAAPGLGARGPRRRQDRLRLRHLRGVRRRRRAASTRSTPPCAGARWRSASPWSAWSPTTRRSTGACSRREPGRARRGGRRGAGRRPAGGGPPDEVSGGR